MWPHLLTTVCGCLVRVLSSNDHSLHQTARPTGRFLEGSSKAHRRTTRSTDCEAGRVDLVWVELQAGTAGLEQRAPEVGSAE